MTVFHCSVGQPLPAGPRTARRRWRPRRRGDRTVRHRRPPADAARRRRGCPAGGPAPCGPSAFHQAHRLGQVLRRCPVRNGVGDRTDVGDDDVGALLASRTACARPYARGTGHECHSASSVPDDPAISGPFCLGSAVRLARELERVPKLPWPAPRPTVVTPEIPRRFGAAMTIPARCCAVSTR